MKNEQPCFLVGIGGSGMMPLAMILRARGVTHLYVGARGGFLDPAELSRNGEIETLYAREGAWWFRVGEGR